MKRSEFLGDLRQRLSGILPWEDAQDALAYYEEYFDDAGIGRDDPVPESLPTPKAIVEGLLAGRQDGTGKAKGRAKRSVYIATACICLILVAAVVGLIGVLGREDPTGQGPITADDPTLITTDAVQPTTTAQAEPTDPATTTPPTTQGQQGTGGANQDESCVLEAFKGLDVKLGIGELIVVEGEAFGIAITTYGTVNSGVPYRVTYEMMGSTLLVRNQPSQSNVDEGSSLSASIVITIPADSAVETAKLYVAMGSVSWRGGEISGQLDCDVAMGAVDIDAAISGDAAISVGMGTLTLDTGLPRENYSYELSGTMGQISIAGERNASPKVSGGTGEQKLDLSNSMGTITLRFAS